MKMKLLCLMLAVGLCFSMLTASAVSAEDSSASVSLFIENSEESKGGTAIINIGVVVPEDKVYSGNFRVFYDPRFLERTSTYVNDKVLNDYYDAFEAEVQEGEVYLEFCNYGEYLPEGKSVLIAVTFNLKPEVIASSDEADVMNNLFRFDSYSMRDKEENTLEVIKPTEYMLGKNLVMLMGDSDCSGSVNIKDATFIQKVIANIHSIDGSLTFASDVTDDGKLSIKDATAIQKYCAKILVQAKIGVIDVYETSGFIPY